MDQQTNPQPPPVQERPDWLPEKFKDVEQLYKSYQFLEQRLGQQGQPQGDPGSMQVAADGTVTQHNELTPHQRNLEQLATEQKETEQAQPSLTVEQLTAQQVMDAAAQEFQREGKLSPETVKNIRLQAGVPESVVQQFVDAQR